MTNQPPTVPTTDLELKRSYEIVLSDLRKQRAELDTAIYKIKCKLGIENTIEVGPDLPFARCTEDWNKEGHNV